MTMLGLLGGQILKGVQGHGKKLAWLLGAGAGCLILGYVWLSLIHIWYYLRIGVYCRFSCN